MQAPRWTRLVTSEGERYFNFRVYFRNAEGQEYVHLSGSTLKEFTTWEKFVADAEASRQLVAR